MANLSSKTGTVTTPVQTQISLANNAATPVQDMSAYDSQEVTGFVYVDATADLRCSFKVMVVKNGAGTYEVASTDLSGDNFSSAPMLSFSMSGSILQATLPNVTGFASAYLRYQLSAPYLGGNYPLTVSARQVAGDVSGVAVPAGYVGEVVEVVSNLTNFPVAGTWNDFAAAIQLTAGVWTISYVVDFELNGATMQQISIGIGTASGSSTTGLTIGSSQVGANVPTAQTNASGCIPNFYVRLNSTTLYYGKIFGGYTAGTPRYRGRLTAVRIA